LAEGHWLVFNTMSVLSECLSGGTASSSGSPEKFAEAERLLLDGYEGLTAAAESIPESIRDQRIRQAVQRIVKLYDAWHAAELDDEGDHGRDARATIDTHATKAAEWRAVLEGIEGSGDPGIEEEEPSSQPAASAPAAKQDE